MRDKLKDMSVYLFSNVLFFYVIPFFINDFGTGVLVLLKIIPGICFITSLVYGMKKEISWMYPVIVGLLFVPAAFIYFNYNALIYALVYAGIAAFGSLSGKFIMKNDKNKKKK